MYTRAPPQLQSQRAGPNTRCQKCLKFGHFTYECTNAKPYVARPSRTQQLESASSHNSRGERALFGRGQDRDAPSVQVPEEFLKGGSAGVADKILKAKEEARRKIKEEEAREQRKAIKADLKVARDDRTRASVSKQVQRSSSESSDSAAIEDSPPRRERRRYSLSPSRSASPPPRRRSPSPVTRRSPSPVRRRPRSPTLSRSPSRSPPRRRRRYTSESENDAGRSRSPVRRPRDPRDE